MKVAIIGGGAAGFFSAINVKENYPEAIVVIFEKSNNVLTKVKISGGGRCNFTNAVTPIKEFAKAYPRGEMKLRKALGIFGNKEIMQWFDSRGVSYIVQNDNCVFPASQKSQSIVDCFLNESKRLSIKIRTASIVTKIEPISDKVKLLINNTSENFDKVIVTTGGSPKRKGLEWLENLGHNIQSPVPSLFTFNMPDEPITKLMGIVVENTIVSIQGTKLNEKGALLITHWGMSGPAILKLSAYGARFLYDNEYDFNLQVNWINERNANVVLDTLKTIVKMHPKKRLNTIRPYNLQLRLWNYLLEKSTISNDKIWQEVGKKQLNKLVSTLTNDIYKIKGKTTFKEEFVTCGGVDLENIDFKTMQSKVVENLYFAGEVIDVDGITGGYNFQAAWTTGFIAGKLG
jgi:predicted Rossmann fold flavoprotein